MSSVRQFGKSGFFFSYAEAAERLASRDPVLA